MHISHMIGPTPPTLQKDEATHPGPEGAWTWTRRTSSQVCASHQCPPAAQPLPPTCLSIPKASFKTPASAPLGFTPEKYKLTSHKNLQVNVQTAQTRNPPRRPSTGEWFHLLCYGQNTTQHEKGIVLSEKAHTQRLMTAWSHLRNIAEMAKLQKWRAD